MKGLFYIITLVLLIGCQGVPEEALSSLADIPNVDTPNNAAPKAARAPIGESLEVIVFPLANKYRNGLRDSDFGITTMTRDKWEARCISENTTGKTYSYPMANVYLLEYVGHITEDQEYATYIRDNWLYGIDLYNADVYDKDGNLISIGLEWLLNASEGVNLDFLEADATTYLGNKYISAGHHYRADNATVGTLLFNYNTDNMQAQFNTDNNQLVHYYCVAYQ